MVLITIVNGAYKPTNITRGPHIVSPMVLVSIMPELVINQRRYIQGFLINTAIRSPCC